MQWMTYVSNEYTNGVPSIEWLILGSSSVKEARQPERMPPLKSAYIPPILARVSLRIVMPIGQKPLHTGVRTGCHYFYY